MGTSHIGPYALQDTVAAGGMGVVYRAVDPRGRAVALKTVRVVDGAMLGTLRREVRSLRGLRHPGIVRFLDAGVTDSIPWYVMAWIDGTPLSGGFGADAIPSAVSSASETWSLDDLHTDEVPRDGSPVVRPAAGGDLIGALTRVWRLCGALAYLHGEGCVHRDLKPSNVLVGADGWPILVDFGLLTRFGGAVSREALEVVAPRVGTPLYIAPEQIRGELVDARADLYALGCLLYELVVGVPPFLGTPRAVLDDHLYRVPLRPSEHVQDVPPDLDDLVMELLVKDPARRIGYAEDVARALADLGADTTPWPGAPKPRPYLYRPTLVGRAGADRPLRRALDALADGDGGRVLIVGDSGSGKTRLALELARSAVEQGLAVWVGECLEGDRAPLGPLRDPLRAIADSVACRDDADRLFGRRGGLFRLFVPEIGALPGQDQVPDAAELPPSLARGRLLDWLRETFGAAAARRPALLLIDDLQWADDLSLAFLEDLAARGPVPGLLVLATCRAEEMGARHRALADAWEAVRLDALAPADVRRLVRAMLARAALPDAWLTSMSEQAEGNPFFVSELVRVAVAEGQLVRDHGAWQVVADGALPLPTTVREVVERRLAGLPGDARSLVLGLAVIGREAEPALAGAVLDLDGEWLQQAADELVRRRVLEVRGDGRLRFVHDKLHETAYAGLPEATRRLLHRRAADAIEAAGPEPERLAVLARHRARAAQPVEAFHAYRRAAEAAIARAAHADAARLYDLALAHDPDDPVAVVEALQSLAHQLVTLGRAGEALERLALADPHLPHVSRELRLRTAVIRSRAHRAQGEIALALALADGAVDDLSEEDDDALLVSEALLAAMLSRLDQGRADEARELGRRAAAAARRGGHDRMEGIVLLNLGTLDMRTGRHEEATRLLEGAVERLDAANDRRAAAVFRGNLGTLLSLRGDVAGARAAYLAAIEELREVSDQRHLALYQGNVGLLAWEAGDLDEADRWLASAIDAFTEQRDRLHVARYRIVWGHVRIARGELALARADLEPAKAFFAEEAGIPLLAAHARVAMARLLRLEGDLPAARAELRAARAAVDGQDPPSEAMLAAEEGHCRLAAGETAHDELARARALLAQAHQQEDGTGYVAQAVAGLARAVAAAD